MTREIVYLPPFDKNWNKLNLTDKELIELENMVINNPQIGNVIEGTGGLRKMRFALPNRGKSGSVRILYVDFVQFEQLYFVNVYAKNEQENISDTDKKLYKQIINETEKILKGRR